MTFTRNFLVNYFLEITRNFLFKTSWLKFLMYRPSHNQASLLSYNLSFHVLACDRIDPDPAIGPYRRAQHTAPRKQRKRRAQGHLQPGIRRSCGAPRPQRAPPPASAAASRDVTRLPEVPLSQRRGRVPQANPRGVPGGPREVGGPGGAPATVKVALFPEQAATLPEAPNARPIGSPARRHGSRGGRRGSAGDSQIPRLRRGGWSRSGRAAPEPRRGATAVTPVGGGGPGHRGPASRGAAARARAAEPGCRREPGASAAAARTATWRELRHRRRRPGAATGQLGHLGLGFGLGQVGRLRVPKPRGGQGPRSRRGAPGPWAGGDARGRRGWGKEVPDARCARVDK